MLLDFIHIDKCIFIFDGKIFIEDVNLMVILKFFSLLYVCLYECVPHECGCPQRPQEDVEYLEDGVINGC